ncbi:MAG: hypothetical protein AAGE52_31550 [Myxococcota bacterium]
MRREDARAFRDSVVEQIEAPMRAAHLFSAPPRGRALPAIGLLPGLKTTTWRVAVRAETTTQLSHPSLEAIMALPARERDVEIVGPMRAAAISPSEAIAHIDANAGTLGAWVVREGRWLALSNNHVLAATNRADIGDPIVHGVRDAREVGELADFVPLKLRRNNVDAALADIDPHAIPDDPSIPRIDLVEEWIENEDDLRRGAVRKNGRRTGLRRGRMRAVGLRHAAVRYDDGRKRRFDEVIEIRNRGNAFASRGDSGSLVVDADGFAVGLVFAVGRVTYVNPIWRVFDALAIEAFAS